MDFNAKVSALNSSMNAVQHVLYVGANYDIKKYPTLAHKKWRCIYTSNQDESIAEAFDLPDRQVRVINTDAEGVSEYRSASAKLNQINPMLICLDARSQAADEDRAAFFEKRKNKKVLLNTLGNILKKDFFVELTIVGYDPDIEGETSTEELYEQFYELSDNRISFFGLSEKHHSDQNLNDLKAKGIISVFEQDIGEELEKRAVAEREEDEFFEDDFDDVDQKNITYIDNRPVALTPKCCYDFSKYGRLLTIEEMNTGTVSRMMQVEQFYNFLKRSPNAPQWYGYAPGNAFAVERNFEKGLYEKVMSALTESTEKPIVLLGQTSSGKSIALARLAYRIFQERKYPVLFVNNPDVNFASDTPASRALDNILLEIQDKGGKALVILDWSIYNLQRSEVIRKIVNKYSNRGRRVVFVASAQYTPSPKKSGDFYDFVRTPTKLEDEEKAKFAELIIEKGKAPRDRVESWLQKNDDKGLLAMLYRLVYELQPQLERGLKQEITQALKDTEERLRELGDIVPMYYVNAITAQLRALGLTSEKERDTIPAEEITKMLQPFSEALAVATLFKLKMPRTLAMRLLNIPECENRKQILKIIFSAPWLYCAMDNDKYAPGADYVSFRDPMDARIYLRSVSKNDQDRLKIVANIIDTAVDFVKDQSDLFFEEEVRFLAQLLRFVGPNSEDADISENWVSNYGANCTGIIDALARMRAADIEEPLLITQEVTYIREYYGDGSNDYEMRVEWLKEAIDIAKKCSDNAVGVSDTQINVLQVESILSELLLEDCYKERPDLKSADKNSLRTYRERKEVLSRIIETQPENSYAYTALLRCFMKEYGEKPISIEQVQDAAAILEIMDITAASIPSVEENEHYISVKGDFLKMFDNICGDDRVKHYFDELRKNGSGVGIYLNAKYMLREAKIDFKDKRPVSAQEKEICQYVLDYLEKEECRDIVKTHSASQYMRLQLALLCYNGRALFAEERQITRMSEEQWEKIYQICEEFEYNIIRRDVRCLCKNSVYYIMALALSQLGEYKKAVEIWKNRVNDKEFYDNSRLRTWTVLCDPNGKPKVFKGTFNRRGEKLEERRIYIEEMNFPVFYRSLQTLGMSERSGNASDLYIGVSYRGYEAFSERWMSRRDW